MERKPVNPLAVHFRQPAIYFKLPSNGKFWPEGSIDLPANSEIPVYPMTVKDEITLKTPDALLNGQGVIDVIHSCCPNITDAWRMPSVDVDATLIAIRIASYNDNMSFSTKCPHCSEENTYEIALGNILQNIRCPNYDNLLKINDIKIKLKPQEYFSINATNQVNYEEQRVLNALADTSIADEVRVEEYKKHMQKIVDLSLKVLVDSTDYIEIKTNDIRVDNPEYIQEFYANCDAEICKLVRKHLEDLSKDASIPPLPADCQSCTKSFDVPLTFDYSNFFDLGS